MRLLSRKERYQFQFGLQMTETHTFDRLRLEEVVGHRLDSVSLQRLAILLDDLGLVLKDEPALESGATFLDLPENMASTTTNVHNGSGLIVITGQVAQFLGKGVDTNGYLSRVLRHHGLVEASESVGDLGEEFKHGLAFAVVGIGVGVVTQGDLILPVMLAEEFVVFEHGWEELVGPDNKTVSICRSDLSSRRHSHQIKDSSQLRNEVNFGEGRVSVLLLARLTERSQRGERTHQTDYFDSSGTLLPRNKQCMYCM